MPDTEAVTKQITGQCVEIAEKNGWTSFSVDVGTQYPVRLSTKLDAIIQAGRAAGSDVAVWTFKESQGKENPNKPGTHFLNRYLDKVETGGAADGGAPGPQSVPENTASGTAPTQQTATPVPESVFPAIAPADKDRVIARLSCLSSAAKFVQGGTYGSELERVSAWLAAADAAERRAYKGIVDDPVLDDDDVPF